MRKTLSFLLVLLLVLNAHATEWVKINSQTPVAGEITLLTSNTTNSVVQFQLDGFWKNIVSTSKGDAWIISAPDAAPNLEKGSPDLPTYAASIIIPDQSAMHLKVVSAKYQVFENILIAPSKGNLLRDVIPSQIPYKYGDQYEINSDYPGVTALLNQPYIVRDYRGQSIKFQPFQYNPVTKTLKVYYHIEVSIEESGQTAENILVRDNPVEKVDLRFNNIYERHFLNYQTNGMRYESVNEFGNMMVIAHKDFLEEIQPLIDWKIKKGISTTLIDVATIGGSSEIKEYIKNEYEVNGLTFVLLVGDHAQVPSSIVKGNDSDNDYSYVVGNDHYPDLFVGRFSAETKTGVGNMVKRTLAYEKNPSTDTTGYKSAIGIASKEGPGDNNEMDYEHIRNIQDNKLIPFTYNYGYEFFEGSQGGNDASGNPSASMVSSAVNSGASIINYTGHGSTNSWATSGFGKSHVNALTNTEQWPFIISVACVNGNFTKSTCFAEAWIRAEHNGEPTGAIATLMSTINQSWNPPMCGQDEMNSILTEAFAENIKRTFGGITMNGCLEMNDSYGGSGFQETDTWTIFGDPSLVVRTDVPSELIVSHPASMRIDETSLLIECPIENAIVALTRDGEILAVETVKDSIALLSVSDLEIGEADIVVTAFNHIPYISTITLKPANGPDIIYADNEVNDSEGNGDGKVDYAETVAISITLENIGNEDADSTSVRLSTSSDYITIISDSVKLGQIKAGESITIEDAFAFDVSEDVPNGHMIQFMLTISDDTLRMVWETEFSLEAFAPKLVFSNFTIDDSEGDGNGKIDPGETVDILVEVTNEGGSSAYELLGQLLADNEYLTMLSEQEEFEAQVEAGSITTAAFRVAAEMDTPGGLITNFTLDLLAEHNISATGEFMVIVGQKAALILRFVADAPSADSLYTSFTSLEVDVDEMYEIPVLPELYKSIFILLGNYPDHYSLSAEEGKMFADYLDSGGNIYMEGGETWHDDIPTVLHTKFHIESDDDSSNEVEMVVGEPGSFLQGYSFLYEGPNNYIDHLSPKGDAKIILSNASPYFGVAVAFENENYKTVGSSISFAGLQNEARSSKDEVLADILSFFEVTHVWTSIGKEEVSVFESNAFPNPFVDIVSIEVKLQKQEFCEIDIHDITGRKITGLFSGSLDQGVHSFNWEAKDKTGNQLTPGIYFYSIKTEEMSMTKKLLLSK